MYTATGALTTDTIIKQHMPLVRRIANHMMLNLPASVDVQDLVQIGSLGLYESIDRYDPHMGVKFETYASQRIRGAMIDELRNNDWISRGVRKIQKDVGKAIRKVEHMTGGTSKDSDVAKELQVSLPEYHEMLNKLQGTQLMYLEDFSSEDDEGSFLDRNLGSSEADPLAILTTLKMRDAMATNIKALPVREQQLMSMYYEKDMNLKEIALVLEVTESRVCQLHAAIIAKLRSKLKYH